MHGLGTLINMAAIAGGGIIGLLFGKRFEKRFQEILMTAVGACVIFVVVDGVLEKMLSVSGDHLQSGGTVMMIGCMAIGAMAVVGAINDGIYGDYSVLAAKAILDLIIILVMTASMGKGCIFSAIPVGIFQGTIILAARLFEPIMTEKALNNLSLVGSVMIFCIGINLLLNKKIRVANMLPSIIIAVMWAFI